eukprot:PhM_4_TR18076/c5_g4_i1/m.44707
MNNKPPPVITTHQLQHQQQQQATNSRLDKNNRSLLNYADFLLSDDDDTDSDVPMFSLFSPSCLNRDDAILGFVSANSDEDGEKENECSSVKSKQKKKKNSTENNNNNNSKWTTNKGGVASRPTVASASHARGANALPKLRETLEREKSRRRLRQLKACGVTCGGPASMLFQPSSSMTSFLSVAPSATSFSSSSTTQNSTSGGSSNGTTGTVISNGSVILGGHKPSPRGGGGGGGGLMNSMSLSSCSSVSFAEAKLRVPQPPPPPPPASDGNNNSTRPSFRRVASSSSAHASPVGSLSSVSPAVTPRGLGSFTTPTGYTSRITSGPAILSLLSGSMRPTAPQPPPLSLSNAAAPAHRTLDASVSCLRSVPHPPTRHHSALGSNQNILMVDIDDTTTSSDDEELSPIVTMVSTTSTTTLTSASPRSVRFSPSASVRCGGGGRGLVMQTGGTDLDQQAQRGTPRGLPTSSSSPTPTAPPTPSSSSTSSALLPFGAVGSQSFRGGRYRASPRSVVFL